MRTWGMQIAEIARLAVIGEARQQPQRARGSQKEERLRDPSETLRDPSGKLWVTQWIFRRDPRVDLE